MVEWYEISTFLWDQFNHGAERGMKDSKDLIPVPCSTCIGHSSFPILFQRCSVRSHRHWPICKLMKLYIYMEDIIDMYIYKAHVTYWDW